MKMFAAIKRLLKSRLAESFYLEDARIGNHCFKVRKGSFRAAPDYDDAWILACAMHSTVMFDVGAAFGDTALAVSLSPSIKIIVLVEANPQVLMVAAENLIRNDQVHRAHFVNAFAGKEVNNSESGRMVTLDQLCEWFRFPDFVKIDVEGMEYEVLQGAKTIAARKETRFLVEMHAFAPMTMERNADQVLSWCLENQYKAWYMKDHCLLKDAQQIQSRGRAHLLLQPESWKYPDWLMGIPQGAPWDSVDTADA